MHNDGTPNYLDEDDDNRRCTPLQGEDHDHDRANCQNSDDSDGDGVR